MKAMILAAGLGTRLKPLTDSVPKAMVTIAGNPLLFYTIQKLLTIGVKEIIINVHHFQEKIIEYVRENKDFGISISFSKEETLLDTGGGLKNVSSFFDDGRPFILHNVDVFSEIDLESMLAYHQHKKSLATLAVRKRKTSRYFLFNQEHHLVGWQSLDTGEKKIVRHLSQTPENLSFMGIHVISPEIFPFLPDNPVFSIIKAYLDLAQLGQKIVGYRNDVDFWIDLGKKEHFKIAEEFLTAKKAKKKS
jgi:NDP-sugar pyrophosphorylase family protein